MRAFVFFFLLGVLPLTGRVYFEAGKYPDPPANGIYDPDNWLTVEARNEMSRDLVLSSEKWGTAVYVMILPEKPDLGDEIFARKIGGIWGDGKLWGLVLHVVGDAESPQFFGELDRSPGWAAEQVEDFEGSIEDALKEVRKRAHREEDQRQQVLRGTRELTDELGYLGLVMGRIDRNYERARGEGVKQQKVEHSRWLHLRRIIMVVVLLAILVLGILIYFFVRSRKERKSNFHFPETSPRSRFLAPWAGGSNVLVQFALRNGEDGSRKG